MKRENKEQKEERKEYEMRRIEEYTRIRRKRKTW